MGELSAVARAAILVTGLVAAGFAVKELGDRNILCWGSTCRTIKASDIRWSPKILASDIWGIFTISHSYVNAVDSNGSGGACLVANLKDLGFPISGTVPNGGQCQKNSDCSNAEVPFGTPEVSTRLPVGWSGYCDTDKHVCWTRPGPQTSGLCNIAGPLQFALKPPLDDGEYPVPVNHYALRNLASRFGGNTVEFRVVACLNGPKTGDKAPCAMQDSDDRIEVMGKPHPIPIPKYVPPPFTTVGTGATVGLNPGAGGPGKGP